MANRETTFPGIIAELEPFKSLFFIWITLGLLLRKKSVKFKTCKNFNDPQN